MFETESSQTKFSNNNSRIKSEICPKLTIEVTGIFLVFLLLILHIFDTFLVYVCFVFFAKFEHVNAG